MLLHFWARIRLYVALIAFGAVVLLRARAKIAADAVEKMAKDFEDADRNRAADVRRAAAGAGRVQRADDPRGYRD